MNTIQSPHLIFGVFILLTAIPSLGSLGQFSNQVSAARTEAQRIGNDMTELKLSQQEADQKAEIAEDRYLDGCLPVVNDRQTEYVTLVEHQPVVDSSSGIALPAGALVCDAHGNTAVLADDDQDPTTPAIAQTFAYTGNKALVDQRLQQYRGAAYSMPQN